MRIIKFETTANQKFEGEVVSDIGHAYEVRVTKGGGKRYVGRVSLFSKAHMIRCAIQEG